MEEKQPAAPAQQPQPQPDQVDGNVLIQAVELQRNQALNNNAQLLAKNAMLEARVADLEKRATKAEGNYSGLVDAVKKSPKDAMRFIARVNTAAEKPAAA